MDRNYVKMMPDKYFEGVNMKLFRTAIKKAKIFIFPL